MKIILKTNLFTQWQENKQDGNKENHVEAHWNTDLWFDWKQTSPTSPNIHQNQR